MQYSITHQNLNKTSSPRRNQHNVGPPSWSGNLQGGVDGAAHLQCLTGDEWRGNDKATTYIYL